MVKNVSFVLLIEELCVYMTDGLNVIQMNSVVQAVTQHPRKAFQSEKVKATSKEC